jgi:hypothetical protein
VSTIKESPNITVNWMPIPIHYYSHCFFFFFQALNFLVGSFGLLNDLFPLPSILDAGYPDDGQYRSQNM